MGQMRGRSQVATALDSAILDTRDGALVRAGVLLVRSGTQYSGACAVLRRVSDVTGGPIRGGRRD